MIASDHFSQNFIYWPASRPCLKTAIKSIKRREHSCPRKFLKPHPALAVPENNMVRAVVEKSSASVDQENLQAFAAILPNRHPFRWPPAKDKGLRCRSPLSFHQKVVPSRRQQEVSAGRGPVISPSFSLIPLPIPLRYYPSRIFTPGHANPRRTTQRNIPQ